MRPDAEIIAGRKARRWSGAHVLESRTEHKTVCDELHWCMRALAQTIGALKVTASRSFLHSIPMSCPHPGCWRSSLVQERRADQKQGLQVAAAREGSEGKKEETRIEMKRHSASSSSRADILVSRADILVVVRLHRLSSLASLGGAPQHLFFPRDAMGCHFQSCTAVDATVSHLRRARFRTRPG